MPTQEMPWILIPLFFLVAALYSSIGHGGASGYLALFALSGMAAPSIIPAALVLNIAVAAISFFNYWRGGHLSLSLLLPFVVTSMPAAYLGGRMTVGDEALKFVLGVALLLVAARLLFFREIPQRSDSMRWIQRWALAAPIGFVLGLLSGIVGIGGGVFLSPVILLLGWAEIKGTAAVSSAFIVLNSVSGLIGHVARGTSIELPVGILVAVVVLGGFLGSRLGAQRLSTKLLQLALGLVLVVAGGKLILPWLV
ncbi:MAG: sulfoacetate exporter [Bacteroidetes bacterium]|nr:sulfoacetate exporter [Bacteroidota bacterium]